MKIESVTIDNFRCYKHTSINFDDYTCFVGPNGAGKSTVFNALNVFFRQYKDSQTDLSKLSIDDFHHKDISKEIRITVTFKELSDAAKADLSAYVRNDKLIVSAVAQYDTSAGIAEVKQYGNRLGMEDFRKYFEMDKNGVKVGELKKYYTELRQKYDDLPVANSKVDMEAELNLYESLHSENCILIPSEDQFYGATKGANRLSPHIQWVFIPAAKDATQEGEESKTSALGTLIARTVRSKVNFNEKVSEIRKAAKENYEKLLEAEQSGLNEISISLQQRLNAWAHPNVKAQVLWKQDPEKSVRVEEPTAYIKVGERGFESDLARFGHGLQRSYMLALLQELSESSDADAPTLIMCIEEPEIYQHPPQARYLAETLIELSERNTQVLICTHSPLFIPGDHFDKVRIVRETGDPSETIVKSISYAELSALLSAAGEKLFKENGMIAKLYPTLNTVTNEMFFCKVLILVEGYEDVAYLTSYLLLSGKMGLFRKYGCHIVPVEGKSSLIKPTAISKLLNIPAFVMFDCDTNKVNPGEVVKHKKDNKALLQLHGHSAESEWPTAHIVKDNLTAWEKNLGECVKSDFGADWEPYQNKMCAYYGNPGDLDKNPVAIAKFLELTWSDGKTSNTLLTLIDRILDFASKAEINRAHAPAQLAQAVASVVSS